MIISCIIIFFHLTQTSPKDTLLTMMRVCTRNKNPIPFIAQGPNTQILREARTISELLYAIKKAILSDWRDSEYTNRSKRDISIISSMPIDIVLPKLSVQKRSSGDQDDAERWVSCINCTVLMLMHYSLTVL